MTALPALVIVAGSILLLGWGPWVLNKIHISGGNVNLEEGLKTSNTLHLAIALVTSSSCMVKLYVCVAQVAAPPGQVGAPPNEIALKLVMENVIPGGKFPEATLQVNGADPLTSLTIPLYAAPIVPVGKVTVGIVGNGTM